MKLLLWDSLSNSKKEFSIELKKDLNIYVCGITPYSYSHLGHGRSYINFDILMRTLLFLEFEINYIRNFTDIDDKMLNRAKEELGDRLLYPVIADKFIKDFHEQMEVLNCIKPSIEPKATEAIPSIVKIIKTLITKEIAYKSNKDIFFDISKFKNYGALSKKKIDELLPGSRININESKKNPLDFALWKSDLPGQFWDTEIGSGRPGWHIECSAMIAEHCGEQIDIHGGGSDLIFPHHENEIAQSEACFEKPLARAWMHNGFISIDKEKMSKSFGNSISMKDYFSKYSPSDFRFYILQHHYRSPIDFSEDKLIAAGKARATLVNLFSELKINLIKDFKKTNFNENLKLINETEKIFLSEIIKSLADDLNTANCIGLIFKNLETIKNNRTAATIVFSLLNSIFGIDLNEDKMNAKIITADIQKLFDDRIKARELKNWALSDLLRDEIIKKGFDVVDKPIK